LFRVDELVAAERTSESPALRSASGCEERSDFVVKLSSSARGVAVHLVFLLTENVAFSVEENADPFSIS
jgi:hypothetical protein